MVSVCQQAKGERSGGRGSRKVTGCAAAAGHTGQRERGRVESTHEAVSSTTAGLGHQPRLMLAIVANTSFRMGWT